MFDIKEWIRHHTALTTVIISVLITSIIIGCFILIPVTYVVIGSLVLALVMIVGGMVYSVLKTWLQH